MMYRSGLHRLDSFNELPLILRQSPNICYGSRSCLLMIHIIESRIVFYASTIFELSPRVLFAIPPKWHDFKHYVNLWTRPPSCSYLLNHQMNSDTYKVRRGLSIWLWFCIQSMCTCCCFYLLPLSHLSNSLIRFHACISTIPHRISASSTRYLHAGMSTDHHWNSASSTLWILSFFPNAIAQLRASFVLFITSTDHSYLYLRCFCLQTA